MVFRPLNMLKKNESGDAEPPLEKNTPNLVESGQPGMILVVKSASHSALPQTASVQNVERRRQFSESKRPVGGAAMSCGSSSQLAGPMARRNVFYTKTSKSLDQIPQYRTDRDEYIRSVTSLKDATALEPANPESDCLRRIGFTAKMRQTIAAFRLLLDVVFILFAVSNLLTSIGFVVPYIFLPNRGLRLGFSASESSLLISMVGISNTVGRLMFGYIADLKCVNRLILYNTVLVTCGICSMFSVLMVLFSLQMCYAFSFGFFIGA